MKCIERIAGNVASDTCSAVVFSTTSPQSAMESDRDAHRKILGAILSPLKWIDSRSRFPFNLVAEVVRSVREGRCCISFNKIGQGILLLTTFYTWLSIGIVE
jgi:hypothetical protein